MEFKGDKGTWTIYGDGKYQLTIDSRIDYGTAISGPKTIAIVNTNGSKEEVLANGILMSKSKEMLEMIERLVSTLEDIESTLAHHNHSITGWHLNGQEEPIMNFFNEVDMAVITDAKELLKTATTI